jgi:hypothetical protein
MPKFTHIRPKLEEAFHERLKYTIPTGAEMMAQPPLKFPHLKTIPYNQYFAGEKCIKNICPTHKL